jgi:gliding motility-associated-like protein
VHRTILLDANASEAAETSSLTWTRYVNFRDSVESYGILRKADAEADFTPYAPNPTVASETFSFSNKNAGDAFKQCYKIAAKAKGSNLVSLSNSSCVDFANKLTYYSVVTPNGDSKNDNIFVKNLSLYPNNKVVVFNRWGKKVWEATNYKNDFEPRDFEAGTYYYQFDVKGQPKRTGWFEIAK